MALSSFCSTGVHAIPDDGDDVDDGHDVDDDDDDDDDDDVSGTEAIFMARTC